MYAMVNTFDNIYNNFNKFYRAGLMTAPMVIIDILVMSPMYTNKRLNMWILIIRVYVQMLDFQAVSDKILP